ncbi:MAG: Spy/CpxP family protein refolding chaperone [Pseudomonadota bacterium]
MKPWIRRSLFGIFGASLALGALTACGHRYGHHGWSSDPAAQAEFRGKMIERVARRLDLNEDQKKRLGVLADKLQAQRTALRGSGGDPREEVRKLVAGDKFDRARAQALVGEKTAAVQTGSPEVIAALGDFYDSLDAKQQAQVREFMQHRRGGWWHRG